MERFQNGFNFNKVVTELSQRAWLGTLHQNIKFKALKLSDFKMDLILIKW